LAHDQFLYKKKPAGLGKYLKKILATRTGYK